jgi:hypothetical protein
MPTLRNGKQSQAAKKTAANKSKQQRARKATPPPRGEETAKRSQSPARGRSKERSSGRSRSRSRSYDRAGRDGVPAPQAAAAAAAAGVQHFVLPEDQILRIINAVNDKDNHALGPEPTDPVLAMMHKMLKGFEGCSSDADRGERVSGFAFLCVCLLARLCAGWLRAHG